ncbi:MAG: PHB depolymerase family esterase [Planctomycetota bacterium]
MTRSWHGWQRSAAGIVGGLVVLLAIPALATEVVLKDGRILRGRMGETVGLAEQNGAGDGDTLKQIVFVNDDFRMIFVPKRQIAAVRPDTSLENAEKFECEQPRALIGRNGRQKVLSVGPPAGPMKDFDDWGRRTYPMRTAGGVLNVVQVITDLTPQYARVEALKQTWDMRIATSTLSDALLDKILMHQINPKNLEHRKKIVRFYLQCKRYGMAVATLQKIILDFKDDTQVAQELQPTLQKLRLLYAQQMLDELGLRRESGQHALVQKILKQFPTEGVTGEILQTVSQVQKEYAAFEAMRTDIEKACQTLMPQVAQRADRAALAIMLQEMGPGLNPEMLPRMAAFLQNQNGALKAEEKLSLAVSGWLLGSDAASTDLPATLSAWQLRKLAQDYLAEPLKVKRDRKLQPILSEVAAKPEVLAALAAHMTPPYPLPDLIDENIPGYSELKISVLSGQPDTTYHVQLPPEYNPQRRYPMIVSLHGIGHDPTMQIDWWAGEHLPDGPPGRQGQAGRYGHIVIAPAWTVEHQKEYEYSAREHAVVVGCVRDACRRFAVDTDRVFLSGHSAGGDAAWDIGVSHPDLWAGVVPISAEAKKTCTFYIENARHVPFYVVLGALDGGRITRNALVLDRYLRNGYNTTIVEYLGRGHEHFVDEQLPLFDWMNRCKRSFPLPRERELSHEREFVCSTMRPGDNFFWWAEIESLPPNAIITGWTSSHEAKPYTTGSGLSAPSGMGGGGSPSSPLPPGTRPLPVRGNVPTSNTLVLTAGNSRTTIWLSPEMVDFNRRVNITVGGRRPNATPAMIKPSVETMLEDLRVRGDRQHPFWAKVETR